MNNVQSTDFIETAEHAFDRQSSIFDKIYTENEIIKYKRFRTRNALEKHLKPASLILELNAGTGEDAIYFAQKGHSIHATDISEKMQEILRKKVKEQGLVSKISIETCSFDDLSNLKSTLRFDAIFSNFGGLNCTENLEKVLASFSELLNPDGIITLVIMPKFCLWETLLALRGNFKLAFRRFFSKNGAKAHIEGVHFLCYYYQPKFVIEVLKKDFELLNFEGLCTLVPPSYFENFPKNYPKIYHFLQRSEHHLKSTFPFNIWGDYYIISFRKI